VALMGETLKLTESESIEIVGSGPDGLEVQATYGPGGSAPPKHFHPAQDERFRVLEGGIRAVIGDAQRELAAGDELEIPRGTPHQMWNPFGEPARVSWTTSPAGRTEDWFRAVDALVRAGRAGGVGGALSFGALLDEYDDTFKLAIGPAPVVGVAVKALGLAGRVTGHGPSR
jgi:mannose-6-phosphate isomerase-like protein (cupin superfamily)